MIFPKKLVPGNTIGIVSPSSPVSAERAAQAQKALESLGFKVKLAENCSLSKGGYMAGDETLRGQILNDMFADTSIDAIICMRGGDGANRILNKIDLNIVRENPKIFIGYSDITFLHLLFNQACDLVTFHGLMVSSNIIDNFDEETKASFFAALNTGQSYTYNPPVGFPVLAARSGKACGSLIGGNLTVMCASLGTPYEMDTKGKILFIEEIGEHIGNLDRHIYQLRDAGKLDDAAGILLGQFASCNNDEDNYTIVNVILDALGDHHIPVMYNIQSGHDFPLITLPMNAPCEMDADAGTITFQMK